MKKRHQLRVVGITYNQIENGVYALILEDISGDRRIPIVIGYPEAQAIECKLQEVATPRPLTHDLMKGIMERFGLRLVCVDLRKLESGVFAADLLIEGADGDLQKIDARSSDAIALALRCGAPIYTSADVLESSGFRRADVSPRRYSAEINFVGGASEPPAGIGKETPTFDSIEEYIGNVGDDPDDDDMEREIMDFLDNYTDKEIEKQISKFAEDEKYEMAARLKRLYEKRRNR